MEREQASIERTLGRIEGTLVAMQRTLEMHTAADGANFTLITDKLEMIDVSGVVRKMAVKWAAGAGAAIALVAEVIRAVGWFP